MAKIYVWRTDGTQEEHDLPSTRLMAACLRLIGAQWVDTVNLRDGRVMLVDDLGYKTREVQTPTGIRLEPISARKPINAAATILYHELCRPGTTHQIVGDVAIVWDQDFA